MRKNSIAIGLAALSLVVSGCSLTLTTVEPEHEHTYADTYSFDDDYHWYAATCEHTELTKDKEEHTYDEWVIDKDPTETETGLMHRDCLKCDYVQTSIIDVLPHEHTPGEPHEENRVEPTCTEPGGYDIVIRCTEDNEIISSEHHEIEARGHDYIHHEGKPATCTEDGYSEYDTCSRCDYSSYTVIPATGHQHLSTRVENEVSATCTENGGYDVVTYCLDDEVVISREHHVVNALGHDIVHHDGKPATCTEPGYEEYDTCSRCDYSTFVEIPAKGHQNVQERHENEIEPTCTKAGSYELVTYCLDDDVELSRETVYVAPLGHDIVHHEGKSATCTEPGYVAYDTCSRCEYTTYQEIPATGHIHTETRQENIVEPTCTEQGHYDLVTYCLDDGAEVSRDKKYTAALGHDYEIIGETEPTFEAAGYITHKCTRCGDEYNTDGKPQLVHTYAEEWSVDTVLGTHYHICLDPGYEDNRGDEAYHSFEWVKTSPTHQECRCTVCGYVDDEGDIEELGDLYKLKFTLKQDDTYMVEAINQSISGYINIPDTYRNKPITSFGGAGFKDCTHIYSIRFPAHLTDIGKSNFNNCWRLKEVVNASSLEIIAAHDYGDYTDITSLISGVVSDVSDSKVRTIDGGYIVYDYSTYTSVIDYIGEDPDVEIPLEVTAIDDHAFYSMDYITTLNVHDNVNQIGDYAFYNCANLSDVEIGDGVNRLWDGVFAYCGSLKNVHIGTGISVISNCFTQSFTVNSHVIIDGENVKLYPYAFNNTNDLNIVEFTNVKKLTLSQSAFNSLHYTTNSGLHLLIPDCLEEFKANNSCFYNTNVIYNSTGYVNYFGNVSNPFVVAYSVYQSGWSMEIVDGTRVIADNFYYGKDTSYLTQLTLPNTLISIGSSAFSGSGLSRVTIPDSVQYIGDSAFKNSSELKYLTLGNGVTKIDNYAFASCYIKTLTLPESLTYIGYKAFYDNRIVDLLIPSNVKTIDAQAFADMKTITSITLNEGLETIGDYAFKATAITSISVPNSVKQIGEGVFNACSSLEEAYFGSGIKTISKNTFKACTALKSVLIRKTVTRIEDSVFEGCSALETIFYQGSAYNWSTIYKGLNNGTISNATIYLYSESQPSSGNYWHYVNGVPTKWQKYFIYSKATFFILIERENRIISFNPKHIPWNEAKFWLSPIAVFVVKGICLQ